MRITQSDFSLSQETSTRSARIAPPTEVAGIVVQLGAVENPTPVMTPTPKKWRVARVWRLFCFWSLVYGVGRTGVGNEVLVTVMLVILLHLLKSVSNGGSRWVEDPRAVRTSPALKVGCFDPYELSTHGQSISRRLKKGDNIGFLYRSYEQRRT